MRLHNIWNGGRSLQKERCIWKDQVFQPPQTKSLYECFVAHTTSHPNQDVYKCKCTQFRQLFHEKIKSVYYNQTHYDWSYPPVQASCSLCRERQKQQQVESQSYERPNDSAPAPHSTWNLPSNEHPVQQPQVQSHASSTSQTTSVQHSWK